MIDRTSDHEIANSCVTESVYCEPQKNKNSEDQNEDSNQNDSSDSSDR